MVGMLPFLFFSSIFHSFKKRETQSGNDYFNEIRETWLAYSRRK